MNSWDQKAKDYEQKVYSITKWKSKRDRILNQVSPGDKVLILGCGSATYLQRDLLNKGNLTITNSDYSLEMIQESKNSFTHASMVYKQEDMRSLSYTQEFDVVISTNSILMESKEENLKVFDNIHKALNPGGKLVAYLPSYDSCLDLAAKNPKIRDVLSLKDSELLVEDKVDNTKQSFHSLESIKWSTLLYSSYNLEKVSCSESKEELISLESLYLPVFSVEEVKNIWEYFLVAKK